MRQKIFLIFVALIILTPGFLIKTAFASVRDGIIDPVYKYAWSENIGWINFGVSAGNVHINDSALTGYLWNDNFGWINLSPSNGGVVNNGEGKLSGYAWGEGVGWIDFSNVSINPYGYFTGYASGTLTGRINFDCAYCKVRTDWRPICNDGIDNDFDGLIDYHNDPGCKSLSDKSEEDNHSKGGAPFLPKKEFYVVINNGATETNSRLVILSLFGGAKETRIMISNFSDFRDAVVEDYTSTKLWNLTEGDGFKTVYVKFLSSDGSSEIISASIIYKKPKLITALTSKIPKILEPVIPKFLKPQPSGEIPLEELISKEAPLSMKGEWNLLTYTRFNLPFTSFTLAPLPKDFQKLAEKFPELGKTFAEVGIERLIDIEKLKPVKLTLPGLTKRVGLPSVKIEGGKFALPQSIPVAKLSPEIKKQIPSEIIFAKTGGELIDFNIALSVNEKGETQQRIETISGKPLQLVIKPEKPVKSVKGYLVFKSKTPRSASFQLPFNSLLASLVFASPVLARPQEKPVRVEEKLVLLEFEYTDPDGDGIYTAEIQSPLASGEYEIITVMDFEDPDLGRKEIRLITVVDPEGYVYEKDGAKETRIPGAVVSLFWLNPETKQYELWPAKEYQQENPQVTDVRGTYAFLVPEGYYYLKVEAPGYLVYDGKPFQVKEGSGIHINIELKTKYWWLKVFDWKTILLIIVILLLLYNFYKDKTREKLTASNN